MASCKHGRGATPRFWVPTTPPTNCWPEAPLGGGILGGAPWGGGGSGGRWGGRFPKGGGGFQAPPNSWLCGLGVIRQLAPPLPTKELRGRDLQRATNDICIAPRLARSGAQSMDDLMEQLSAVVQLMSITD